MIVLLSMAYTSKHKVSSRRQGQAAPSNGIGAAVKRLLMRAMMRVLRFAWRQLVWWVWIGGIALCGYLVVMHTRYTVVGSILFCIAFIIAVCWFMELTHYEDGGIYDDRRVKPRESPL